METEHDQGQLLESNSLQQVTPLSKYLAMVLFVAMPFIGGWVGYTLAPEKIVEVEKVVLLEKAEENNVSTPTAADESEYAVYTYRDSEGWNGAWLMQKDEMTNEFVQFVKLSDSFVNFRATLTDRYLMLHGQTDLILFSLETNSTKEVTFSEAIVSVIPVDDTVLVLTNSTPICTDLPSSNDRCSSTLWSYELETGEMTTVASNMPGAKSLYGYLPDQKIVIRDGYGDGGCAWTGFYEYDLSTSEVSEGPKSSFCRNTLPDVSYDDYLSVIDSYREGLEDDGVLLLADEVSYVSWRGNEGVVMYDERSNNTIRNGDETTFIIQIFIPAAE